MKERNFILSHLAQSVKSVQVDAEVDKLVDLRLFDQCRVSCFLGFEYSDLHLLLMEYQLRCDHYLLLEISPPQFDNYLRNRPSLLAHKDQFLMLSFEQCQGDSLLCHQEFVFLWDIILLALLKRLIDGSLFESKFLD